MRRALRKGAFLFNRWDLTKDATARNLSNKSGLVGRMSEAESDKEGIGLCLRLTRSTGRAKVRDRNVMAKRAMRKQVETLTHEEASRKNISTAEYQSAMMKDDQNPVRVAYKRRNRDLEPQLVWRGKDVQDWSDLVAPPLFIQEKIHPKALIDDLMRYGGADEGSQFDLFVDFNGLPSDAARTEFYRHDANWSNRMILGDSLQVMASLAEREGLRGKVQCIYKTKVSATCHSSKSWFDGALQINGNVCSGTGVENGRRTPCATSRSSTVVTAPVSASAFPTFQGVCRMATPWRKRSSVAPRRWLFTSRA